MKKTVAILLILVFRLTHAAAPTNFIQILTDDQGWGDLAAFGHLQLKTPYIDQLAADGLKLTDCYSSSGCCSPSRAAILTGRTPYRNGVYHWLNTGRELHLKAAKITLPQLLRENGYQTAHFGKWHLSHYANAGRGKPPYEFGNDVLTDGHDWWKQDSWKKNFPPEIVNQVQ